MEQVTLFNGDCMDFLRNMDSAKKQQLELFNSCQLTGAMSQSLYLYGRNSLQISRALLWSKKTRLLFSEESEKHSLSFSERLS